MTNLCIKFFVSLETLTEERANLLEFGININ